MKECGEEDPVALAQTVAREKRKITKKVEQGHERRTENKLCTEPPSLGHTENDLN